MEVERRRDEARGCKEIHAKTIARVHSWKECKNCLAHVSNPWYVAPLAGSVNWRWTDNIMMGKGANNTNCNNG